MHLPPLLRLASCTLVLCAACSGRSDTPTDSAVSDTTTDAATSADGAMRDVVTNTDGAASDVVTNTDGAANDALITGDGGDAAGLPLRFTRHADSVVFAPIVAINAAGDIAVAGEFDGTVDVGGRTISATDPTRSEGFVALLTPHGDIRWLRDVAGASPTGVGIDDARNVVVSAMFDVQADTGTGPIVTHGETDALVAGYGPDGTPRFAHAYGNAHDDRALAVAVRGDGEIAVTGYVSGPVDFGGGAFASVTRESAFTLRLGPAGEYRWARVASGTGVAEGYAVAFGPAGAVAIAGYVGGAVDFGSGPITTSMLDVMAAQYDVAGTFSWVSHFATQGAGVSTFDSVAVDGAGTVYAGGWFRGSATVGSRTLMSMDTVMYFGDALLVALEGSSGAVRWSRAYSSSNDDRFRGLVGRPAGGVVAVGYIGYEPVNLGDGLLGPTGTGGGFLAAFDTSGTRTGLAFEFSLPDPPTDDTGLWSVALNPAGTPVVASVGGIYVLPLGAP